MGFGQIALGFISGPSHTKSRSLTGTHGHKEPYCHTQAQHTLAQHTSLNQAHTDTASPHKGAPLRTQTPRDTCHTCARRCRSTPRGADPQAHMATQ